MTNFEYYKDELKKWAINGIHCSDCPAESGPCRRDDTLLCSGTILAWELKEYIPLKPKQHTMQEIADFLGCSFAKDKTGDIFICTKIPTVKNEEWIDGKFLGMFPAELISDSDSHDWKILVTPKESHE